MHTNSSIQTINRIVGLCEDSASDYLVQRVLSTLRATVSQKLLPKETGGLIASLEIMTVTPSIADYLMKKKYEDVYTLMQRSKFANLMTMNSSIYSLLKQKIISEKTALEATDNRLELEQMIRGIYHGAVQQNSISDLIN